MQLGAALQAVLLAVLLAKPRGATRRLLSGECARWGRGRFPSELGWCTHCIPAAADRFQGCRDSFLALGGEGGVPTLPVGSPPAAPVSRGANAPRMRPARVPGISRIARSPFPAQGSENSGNVG